MLESMKFGPVMSHFCEWGFAARRTSHIYNKQAYSVEKPLELNCYLINCCIRF